MKPVTTALAAAAILAWGSAAQAAPQAYDFSGSITFSATDPSWVGQAIQGSIVVDLSVANFVPPVLPTFSIVKYEYLKPFGTPPVGPTGVVLSSFSLPGGQPGLNIDPPYFSLSSEVTATYHNGSYDQFKYIADQDGCSPAACDTNLPRNHFELVFEDDQQSGTMISSSSVNQVPDLAFATSATGQAYYVHGQAPQSGQLDYAYYVGFDITSFTPAQPVSEPGTWALMGLGLAGIAGLARRRTRV